MHSGENPRRFAALGNAHQDSTDCFCEQGNGGLAAKAYGSVNSIASTITVPSVHRSLGVSGPLRAASPPLAFIPTLN